MSVRQTVRIGSISLELDLSAVGELPPIALERLRCDGFVFSTLAVEQQRGEGWLSALCELDNASRIGDPATPRSEAAFAARLAELKLDPEHCFVARLGEQYVGYTALDASRGDPTTIYQSWTGVRPEYRRRGIATALKALSARHAAARGYRLIRTVLRATNAASIALNTRCGYREGAA